MDNLAPSFRDLVQKELRATCINEISNIPLPSHFLITIWRLNLMVIFGDKLFLGVGRYVVVYSLSIDGKLQKPLPRLSYTHVSHINRLQIGTIDQYPVVIVVDEAQNVCIYNAEEPYKYPPVRTTFCSATWSCYATSGLGEIAAMTHSSTLTSEYLSYIISRTPMRNNVLVVGHNGHFAETRDVSPIIGLWKDIDISCFSEKNPAESVELDLAQLHTFQCNHNVPCVSVSSCGKYIAIASIDNTITVKTSDGEDIALLGQGSWMWYVLWIPKKSIIIIDIGDMKQNEFEINRKNMRDLLTTRSRISWDVEARRGSNFIWLGETEIDTDEEIDDFLDSGEEIDDGMAIEEALEDMYDSWVDPDTYSEDDLQDDGENPSGAYEDWVAAELDSGSDSQEDVDDEHWNPQHDETREITANEWIPLQGSPIREDSEENNWVPVQESSDEEIIDEKVESQKEIDNSKLNECEDKNMNDFLIIGGVNCLYLTDYRLKKLASIVINQGGIVGQMAMVRISVLEYIPEIGILIVSNQGSGIIHFIQIVRFSNGEYELIPKKLFEFLGSGSLTGLAVKKYANKVEYLSYYHIYATFDTNRYCCIELTMDASSNDLDLTTTFI